MLGKRKADEAGMNFDDFEMPSTKRQRTDNVPPREPNVYEAVLNSSAMLGKRTADEAGMNFDDFEMPSTKRQRTDNVPPSEVDMLVSLFRSLGINE